MISSQLTLKASANMTITTDMAETVEIIRHLVSVSPKVLGQISTAIILALRTDLEDKIPVTEAGAAFAKTYAIDTTAQARQVDPDLVTDTLDGTMNIHVPPHDYEICHVYDVEASNTH